MSNDYGFNSTDEVQYDTPGLPVGTHKVMITKEERQPTKDGNAEFLAVTYQAVEGEFKGKTQIQRYNLWNPNERTVSIARQELKKIADATGRPVSADSPLKGRVLNIEIRNQKGSDQYTEVARYSAAE